jgi:hypothetical protein
MNLLVCATSTINELSALWCYSVTGGHVQIHEDSGILTGKEIALADWYAIGHALRYLRDNHEFAEIVLYCTSAHIVKQLKGTTDCPKAFINLRDRCRELALDMPALEIEWMDKEATVESISVGN